MMQNRIFKKIASWTLAWCIALGGMPAAFAEEIAPASDDTLATQTDIAPQIPEHVLSVQHLVDALPSVDSLSDMDTEALLAVQAQVDAAYDAYLTLSAEEQSLITGADAFPALFAVLGTQASTLEASTISFTYKYYAEANSTALSTINGTADAADNKTFLGWLQEQGHSTSNCQYLVKYEGVISPVTSNTLLQADAEYYLFCRIETDTYARKNLMIYHTCKASDISLGGYDFVSTGTDIITGSAATVTLTHTLAGLPYFALYEATLSGSKLTVDDFALQTTAKIQLSDGMAWYDSNAKAVDYISLSEQRYTAGYAVYTTATFPGKLQFSPELPGQHSESNGQFSFTGYATSGTEIQMTVPQDSEKKLVPRVKNATTNEMVTLTEISDNVYQFIMPAGVIEISNSEVTAYPVTIGTFEHGEITANVSYAAVGETVTLTVTPYTNYALEEIKVTDANGAEITLTQNEDGTYSFLMAEGIKITAKFKAAYINFSIRGTNSTTTQKRVENDGTKFLDWLPNNKLYPASTSISCWRVTTNGVTTVVDKNTAIIEGAEYRLLYYRTKENNTNSYLLTIYESCSAETLASLIGNMKYTYLCLKPNVVVTFTHKLDETEITRTVSGPQSRVYLKDFFTSEEMPDGAVLYAPSSSTTYLKLDQREYRTYYKVSTSWSHAIKYDFDSDPTYPGMWRASGLYEGAALPGSKVTLSFYSTDNTQPLVGTPKITNVSTGDEIAVTKESGDVYSFNMPSSKVTVDWNTAATPYAITSNTPSNGTIAITNATGEAITDALPGDTVTITLTPKENYGVDTLAVTAGENSVTVTPSADNPNKYTFTMPNAPVTITATFKRYYEITLPSSSTTGGTVKCDKTVAAAGETVTLTVIPESNNHYVVDTITVQRGTISYESIGDNQYTFIMPEARVTVSVKFVQKYAVTVEQTTGGTVGISLSNDADAVFSGGPILVAPKDQVYIKVTPDESYTFDGASSITILDASTEKVFEITPKGSNGIYHFSMQSSELRIHADFISTEENASINIIGKNQPATTYKAPEGTKFLAWTASKHDDNLFSNSRDTWQWRMTLNGTTSLVDENTLIVSGATYTLMYVVSSKKLYIYDSCNGSDFVNAPSYTSFRLAGDEAAVTLTHTIDGTQYTQTITKAILRDDVSVSSFAALCGLETDGRVWFTEGATDVSVYLSLTPQSYTTYSQLKVAYNLYNIQNVTFSPEGKVRGTGSYNASFYHSDFNAIAGETITMTLHPAEGQKCKFILMGTYSAPDPLPSVGNNSYTFTVPETGLVITPSYLITTTAEHGTITLTGTDSKESNSYGIPDRTVSFSVTPEEGYVLDTVTVINESTNGAIVATDNTFTMPNSPVTITATFKSTSYAITTNAPTNGTFTVTNAAGEAITSASSGDTVTITLTPNDNYNAECLTVKAGEKDVAVAQSANDSNVYTFTMPAQDVTITATFEKASTFFYTNCKNPSTFKEGFVPKSETTFLNWLAENDTYTNGFGDSKGWHVLRNGTEEIVTVDTKIQKDDQFILVWYVLEQQLAALRSFSASELPPLENPFNYQLSNNATVTVTHTVDGQEITFKIAEQENGLPNVKDFFDQKNLDTTCQWYYNGHSITIDSNNLPIYPGVLASQHSISVAPTRNITATIMNAEGETIEKALTGDTVTVTLTSEAPNEITPTGLTVKDSEGNTIPCTSGEDGYTFTMPGYAVTVHAQFVACHTITITEATGGTVTTSPEGHAAAGTSVTVNISPDSTYKLDSVTVQDANGASLMVLDNCFIMPDSDVTITATFTNAPPMPLPTSFTVIGADGQEVKKTVDESNVMFYRCLHTPEFTDFSTFKNFDISYWRVQRANGLTETVRFETIIQRGDIYTLVAETTDMGLNVYANCTAEELPGDNFRTFLRSINNRAKFTVTHTVDGNDVTFTITDGSPKVRDAFEQNGINIYLQWKVGNDTVNMNDMLPLMKTTYTSIPNSAKYPLTIEIKDGQGTVTVNGQSTDSSYAEGTVMTVVATPATGWKVTSLSCIYAEGDNFVPITLSEANTFTMPAKAVNVSVTFGPAPADPTYTITIPASVSLNSDADLTVTASDVTNLGTKTITVTASSKNGAATGNGLMLLSGDTRYGLDYAFTPSLTFTENGNQSLGLALQEGATTGMPAGTYTDTLTFSVALTTTSSAE